MIRNHNFSVKKPSQERGAILIMSLVILVAFTIFMVTMVNNSGSSFVVVGNQQMKKKLDNAAREAIERSLNTQVDFTSALAGSTTSVAGTINGESVSFVSPDPTSINGYTIKMTLPYCYGAKNPPGYSSLSAVAPEDTHWKVSVIASDPVTGATSVITEGVKIRMGAGNCGTTF